MQPAWPPMATMWRSKASAVAMASVSSVRSPPLSSNGRQVAHANTGPRSATVLSCLLASLRTALDRQDSTLPFSTWVSVDQVAQARSACPSWSSSRVGCCHLAVVCWQTVSNAASLGRRPQLAWSKLCMHLPLLTILLELQRAPPQTPAQPAQPPAT